MQEDQGGHFAKDKRTMYCFNPACASPCHRMFSAGDAAQHHAAFCTKWLMDLPTVTRLFNRPKVDKVSNREDGAFFSAPIAAMMRFFERKQAFKIKIASIYDDLKKTVLGWIENCKVGKLMELEFMSRELEAFRNVIEESVTIPEVKDSVNTEESRRAASIAINSIVNSYKFTVPIFKDLEYFNASEFIEKTANLKQHIDSIGSVVLKEIEIQGGYERLQYSDMLNVEIMLLKERKLVSEKCWNTPEPLAELVTWHESEYFIQRSKAISEILCPLCDFKFETGWVFGIGKSKSAYYDVLVKHLLEDHLLYLALCFSHRISKNAVQELPLSEILYLMSKYNYDQIDIYDMANPKGLRYEPNPRCLTILFAPDGSRFDDFEYSYCITNTPEEICYNIVMIMEEACLKKGKAMRLFNFKRNYINLFSSIVNKYSLKCQLEEKYANHPVKAINKLTK